MTPKRIVIYASLCFSNIGGAHSFTVTPKFESALGSVIAKQQQIQKVTTSTLFYNDRNKESQEGESSLWLPSSGLSQDDQLLKMKNDMNRFASAKGALEELRSDIKQMKENLALSLVTDDLMRIVALKKSINEALEKDPEFVYSRALGKIKMARESGKFTTRKKYEIISKYTKEAEVAREFIPRLNMHGLWIANFGDGAELVNVTYVDDTLLATRLKQPDNVFFQADLSPKQYESVEDKNLNPIKLDQSTSSKWGVDKLDRYPGEGRDALNKKPWNADPIDGNLIMFDGYFSFLWVPTRQHVFFSRPKQHRIMELLRDCISKEDELLNMRDHVSRCFEKNIDDAILRPSKEPVSKPDPFRRIATESDLQTARQETRIVYEDFPLHDFTRSKTVDPDGDRQSQSFWAFHKWMHYIDSAMKPDNEVEGNKKQ